jgi:hypothetical protein
MASICLFHTSFHQIMESLLILVKYTRIWFDDDLSIPRSASSSLMAFKTYVMRSRITDCGLS